MIFLGMSPSNTGGGSLNVKVADVPSISSILGVGRSEIKYHA